MTSLGKILEYPGTNRTSSYVRASEIILLGGFFFWFTFSFSQGEDLFNSLRQETVKDESLIPKRMIFTQRALWGNKGLLRKFGIFPLNVEQREKELKLRRSMLKIHQIIGYLTLAGMVTQLFCG